MWNAEVRMRSVVVVGGWNGAGRPFVLLRRGECERMGSFGWRRRRLESNASNASRPEAPGRVRAHLLGESGPPVHVHVRHGDELVVGIGVRLPQRARRGREPSRPTRGHHDHRRLPGGRRLRCGAPERARAPSAPRRAPEERRGGCVHRFRAVCFVTLVSVASPPSPHRFSELATWRARRRPQHPQTGTSAAEIGHQKDRTGKSAARLRSVTQGGFPASHTSDLIFLTRTRLFWLKRKNIAPTK